LAVAITGLVTAVLMMRPAMLLDPGIGPFAPDRLEPRKHPFLVDSHKPAIARDNGAVAFSGDTAPSQNLIKLAKGADILVREVIVSAFIEGALPPPRSPAQEAVRQHLLSAHTPVEQVGKVA